MAETEVRIDEHITQHTKAGNRWYQVDNAQHHSPDDKLWSVTTILSKLYPKQFLTAYNQKQFTMLFMEALGIDMPYENTLKAKYSKYSDDERPDRIQFTFDGLLGDVLTRVRNGVGGDAKQKAEWGTQAHDIIAKYLKGEQVEEILFDVDDPVRNSVRSFQNWHNNEGKDFQVFSNLVEKTIYHPTVRYAGTADAIFADKKTGKMSIVDWKTGFVGKEAEYQVGALASAWNRQHDEDSYITTGYIIELPRDDRNYKIHPVDRLEELGHAFITASQWHEELQRGGNN